MIDDEIAREFLLESIEHLNTLDAALLDLEKGGSSDIDAIFRGFHSIKSAASFLEISLVEEVAHQAENTLSILRSESRPLPDTAISTMFLVCDVIRKAIEAFQNKVDFEYENKQELLDRLANIDKNLSQSPPKRQPQPSVPTMPEETSKKVISRPKRKKRKAATDPPVAKGTAGALPEENESSIHISISLIDEIINLIGELVVSRNQAIRVIEEVDVPEIRTIINRIDHLTTIIQQRIMTTRMRVIESAWRRYPRMVRDLSKELGKQINLKMIGQETELDRGLLSMLQEPMRHLLRNCIDHGIEFPEDRVKEGKPPEGTISLKAYQSTGQVVIEIADDGKGLDDEKILEKALRSNLLTEEQAAHLDSKEIHKLIFEPGFSTKQAVTQISGRGVGMDVVQTQVKKAGGQVEIESTLGKGACFTIRVPLTLAILPALIVKTNHQYFAIPQDNIAEIIDLQDKTGQIKPLGDSMVYSLRGKLLPILFFESILSQQQSNTGGMVVVLRTNDLEFGLVIHEVMDTEEVVVKPLGEELKGFQIFSGVTIQGNGQIAWILDPSSLANSEGLRAEQENEVLNQGASDITPVLRFEIENIGSAAIDIQKILRVEEIHDSELKVHGARCLYTIERKVIPVYTFGCFSEEEPRASNLIICESERGLVAMRVEKVFDIYSEEYEVSHTLDSLGPMIILDDIPSELIDPNNLSEANL
ncbi:MAG: chemotaxis protein CheA [Myxococcota bacterium]|nr:chemotaxis protein CheA [Myxococcota bacterium]